MVRVFFKDNEAVDTRKAACAKTDEAIARVVKIILIPALIVFALFEVAVRKLVNWLW